MKIAMKYPLKVQKCSYESTLWNRQTIEWNALPMTYERKPGKLMKEIHRHNNETFHWTTKHYKQSPAVNSRHLSGFYHKSGYHQSISRALSKQSCNLSLSTTQFLYKDLRKKMKSQPHTILKLENMFCGTLLIYVLSIQATLKYTSWKIHPQCHFHWDLMIFNTQTSWYVHVSLWCLLSIMITDWQNHWSLNWINWLWRNHDNTYVGMLASSMVATASWRSRGDLWRRWQGDKESLTCGFYG